MEYIPCVLSIAGSDSGGGAGIQADLKAFARCGVHGMTAITAVTAQSTVGVRAVHPVPGGIIEAQVRAVRDDLGVDAVKIGMLGTVQAVAAVARALEELDATTPVVLDPVMVAESGARLLDPTAREALVERLLPRATVITPNLPEAAALVPTARREPEALARAVYALGPRAVVLTGGHRPSDRPGPARSSDLYFDGARTVEIAGRRHAGGSAHGSGCTHSSALAAHLARGHDSLRAARAGRIAGNAVRDGLGALGRGAGPVDVFGLTRRASRRAKPGAEAGRSGILKS